MKLYFWVSLGGAIGTAARFWLSGTVARFCGETFPWGTLIINVTGSFVIGFFANLTAPEGHLMVPPSFRTFFLVGICGGYTTFSSFSLQTLYLIRDREWLWAAGNVLGSVLLCLFGVWVGSALGQKVNPN